MNEEHPSGLEDEDELASVSVKFFSEYSNINWLHEENMWAALLAFQKGWKACKDFYKISD